MLQGIETRALAKHADERGFFTELVRQDWIADDSLQQCNFSITYPGVVRAWHKHIRGQTDYFVVLRGAIKLCAYDDATAELNEIILTSDVSQSARIPGHYWHGFRVLGEQRAYLVYFVNKLYEYATPDEERRPWNDPTICPSIINGETQDVRCGKPWDWMQTSFK
ncbi:MAG: dTDP-4-dehydrorhamnose 3,5-epimerase family protein [Halobacteriota archaeon]|jgi:dTDP-4-dehydrorhamnose 3,5-epimerase